MLGGNEVQNPVDTQTTMPPPGFEYASFSLRALAFAIDQCLLLAAILVLALPMVLITGLLQLIAWPFVLFIVMPPGWLLMVVIAWVYFALPESSKHRATFGKRLCGIQVTDMEGNRPTLARATTRFFGKFLSCAILMIGFIMAAFTERHQALHDILAETLVLKKV
ncbi:MAG TPA: RDD family protein [Alphaproteobacteria bacterium]|nr:RDD family protein [Alphaproteobacteria bacterium]